MKPSYMYITLDNTESRGQAHVERLHLDQLLLHTEHHAAPLLGLDADLPRDLKEMIDTSVKKITQDRQTDIHK